MMRSNGSGFDLRSWIAPTWAKSSSAGRVAIGLGVVLFVLSGAFLFYFAWTLWQGRTGGTSTGIAVGTAVLGVLWFGSVAAGVLGDPSPQPDARGFAAVTTTTEAASTTTTSATSTTTTPSTTTTTRSSSTTTSTPTTTTNKATTTTEQPTTTTKATSTTTPPTTTSTSSAPGNPGDSKNCPDFKTWKEAQDWFDKYFPYYGDVAGLDADDDGVACESLPGAP